MLTTKVAIVGLGTVGTGVARLLVEHGDRIARHAGRRLELVQAVVKDLAKPRDIKLPAGTLSQWLRVLMNQACCCGAFRIGVTTSTSPSSSERSLPCSTPTR